MINFKHFIFYRIYHPRAETEAIQRKQTVQPYLLVLGQSLLEPKSFYIFVEDLYHQFSFARKAFDIIFNLFHVLDVNYPVQCQYLYVIIQRCVLYNIVKNSDDYILEFITKLIQISEGFCISLIFPIHIIYSTRAIIFFISELL